MSWDRNIVIKSQAELALMREAGRVNALALATVREMIGPGVATADLDAAAEEVIRKHGGVPVFKGYPGAYPFAATLCVSVNEELVHGFPSKRRLKDGDVVSVDCGTLLEGFVGDAAFTVGLLRQQLRAIQQELGEDPESTEVEGLRQRLDEAKVPDEVRKEIDKELRRLEKVPSASPEHHVIRSYVELVLELPWTCTTADQIDIAHSRAVLDEDHYDLKEVKERILEQLGVLKLNPEAKAPILCFVGPPGVGKTSLGQSIARSVGRKFDRMSLGGMHDEAELRGHRRTYVGAMPGRILQAIRRAGVKNPLLMLGDEHRLAHIPTG